MKFRKKPVEIEARQLDDSIKSMDSLVMWINENGGDAYHNGTNLFIETLEGVTAANVGDWIIQGIEGEFYPCKSDIFDRTYIKAE